MVLSTCDTIQLMRFFSYSIVNKKYQIIEKQSKTFQKIGSDQISINLNDWHLSLGQIRYFTVIASRRLFIPTDCSTGIVLLHSMYLNFPPISFVFVQDRSLVLLKYCISVYICSHENVYVYNVYVRMCIYIFVCMYRIYLSLLTYFLPIITTVP